MAGITAVIRYLSVPPSPADLLCGAIGGSFPLPELKRVVTPADNPRMAMGGTYPLHFQRKAESFKIGGTTLLFYGELYNDLKGKNEAEFMFEKFLSGGFAALDEIGRAT